MLCVWEASIKREFNGRTEGALAQGRVFLSFLSPFSLARDNKTLVAEGTPFVHA
jgi:hypothetical protein